MKFVFVGMGGTNTFVLRPLLMYLNSSEIEDKDVVVIDGDHYDTGNLERQDFNPKMISVNKAEAKVEEFKSMFPDVVINAVPEYLRKDEIDYYIEDGDVVLLAVDCLMTRKLVDDHCNTLDNILLVSMGNELSDGDIQVCCRVQGENLTPSIQKGHPEISNALNITRSEMSCEEMAAMPSGGQLIFANLTAATSGVNAVWKILKDTEYLTKKAEFKFRGAYFDVSLLKVRPITNHLEAV